MEDEKNVNNNSKLENEQNFSQNVKNEETESNNELKVLKEKLAKQKEDIEDKDDRIKRLMAEFENFKKEVTKKEQDFITQLWVM